MDKLRKWILYAILGIFLLIQFYPVKQPEVTYDNPYDLIKNVNVPDDIALKLRNTCYDCHSNETAYPWYSNIAPVKWLLYDHVEEAREELNFSLWNKMNKEDKADILDDLASEVLEKEMPLKFYPYLHSKAKLTDTDRQKIADWAESYMEELYE